MTLRNKKSRHTTLSLRYGILLSSISIFCIFSILGFYGKLQAFTNLRENYNKASVTSTNATTTTNVVPSNRGSDDDSLRPTNNTTKNTIIVSEILNESNTQKRLGTSASIIGVEKDHEEKNQRDDLRNEQQGQELLDVAWLMSFPNSGTTYTNHLIQGYTNTTTATNYGHEQDTKKNSISIFPDSIDGPFYRYPSWSFPPKYILTKTHCGGECDACQIPGNEEYINSTQDFEKACCTGKRIVNGTKIKTLYSPDVLQRAVHLIRHPFDNIVARLHLRERHWEQQRNDPKYQERVALWNRTKDGFRAYCEFRDTRSFRQEFKERSLSNEILMVAKDVPCYQEFVTYTRWHNYAVELLAEKSIPVLTLFYEDYALDWNKTVQELLDFLLLSPAPDAQPEEFILGKHYDEFYDQNEKLAAKKLVQELASAELWSLLQRYF